MRHATVVADQSLSVHAEIGGENVLGYLLHGERVLVIGGPVKRRRQWWQIITNRQFGQGSPNVTGWVADGDGTAKWLSVDDEEPVEPPVGTMLPGWIGVVMMIIAIAVVLGLIF